MTPEMNRRDFLYATSVGVVALSTTAIGGGLQAPSPAFEHGNPLKEFSYHEVQFAAGPHQAQVDHCRDILMGINEEGLLRPFRMAAGLPAPGRDLPGWYPDPDYGPGTFGQWLSALSRYVAISGDTDTRAKVERLVEAFAQTVNDEGSIFTTRKEKYSSYMFDKLAIGLCDAHRYCGVQLALETMTRVASSAKSHLPGRAIDYLEPVEHIGDRGAHESYTIPENQFLLWQVSGASTYFENGKKYLDAVYFESLAAGRNVLPGRHAYSHVNALSSAAKAYLVTGDTMYLDAAVNGLKFVEAQSFATGGWGPDEVFLPDEKRTCDYADMMKDFHMDLSALDNLGESIRLQPWHFETGCGSYAHFKLTRYLLRITRNSRYGDSMERVMYNCALGVLPLTEYGNAFYNSSYSKYATKTYFDGLGGVNREEWPCCSGTLPQLVADYRISAYFHDERGVFVNLYIPSTVRWTQSGTDVSLTLSGNYPLADEVYVAVEVSRQANFTLHFRIPAWTTGPVIRVNGQPVAPSAKSGSFAGVTRLWQNGDKVELSLPKRLELQAVGERHPDLVALVNGPVVLFAIGYDLPKFDRATLLAARQTGPAAPEWRSGAVRFLPWWHINREVYTTYHDVG